MIKANMSLRIKGKMNNKARVRIHEECLDPTNAFHTISKKIIEFS
jgi:hypothetical protein